MSEFHWIIDTILLERAEPTGQPSLEEAAKLCGHQSHIVKYVPFKRTLDGETDLFSLNSFDSFVFYGTLEGLNALKRFQKRNRLKWSPTYFGNFDDLSYSGYSPYIGEYMLNKGYYLLPLGDIKKRIGELLYVNRHSFFIRPNKVTKNLAARVIDSKNFDLEITCLKNYEAVSDQELVVITPEINNIDFEFRFIVINGKVVTGSQYMYNGRLDIRSDVLPQAQELAEIVAEKMAVAIPHLDAYTADIAVCDGLPSVLELNMFNCAGLYACDTVKTVKAVEQMVLERY